MKKENILMMAILIIIFGIFVVLGIFVTKTTPTQQEVLEELKLCRDNNFDAYQVGSGHWFCKPKDI